MFFDMEGDPLFEGGLEYLFGIVTKDGDEERFFPFWAHDRGEEKAAFQMTVDFLVERLDLDTGFMQNVCQGAVSCTEVAKRDAADRDSRLKAAAKLGVTESVSTVTDAAKPASPPPPAEEVAL